MIAEGENVDDLPESLGDYGGGVSEKRVDLETTRMIDRAVHQRWPVAEKFRPAIVNRQIKMAIGSEDDRQASIACRCILEMERQNQADEHKSEPDLVDLNIRSQILEDPDFYGNYDLLTKIAAASCTDPFASRPVQADDLRPEVGENGNGSSRSD